MPIENSTEIWKPVVGWEGWYSVSKPGRVRRDMTATGATVGRILKTRPHAHGYRNVALHKPGFEKLMLVHRLVLESFVGPCPPGHEGNHKNGDKADNRLTELERITRQENMRHARCVLGHTNAGMRHGNAILRDFDVLAIRRVIQRKSGTHRRIAEWYGISHSTVEKIARRAYWRHL